MPIGITTDVFDEVALVTFDDPALRGPALAALVAGGHAVKVDTGGTRRRYRVSVAAAEAVGLIDAPKPKAAPKADPKPKAAPKAKAAKTTKAKDDEAAPADGAAWV